MSAATKLSAGPARLDSLTGLRAIAAFWVVSYHYSFSAFRPLGTAHASAFVDVGFLGVDLFFMLSGFVIWHVHAKDFEQPGARVFARFMGLRAARLYPVHLFTLGLMAVLLWAAPLWGSPPLSSADCPVRALPLQLTLMQSWGISNLGGWNYPAWSVSAEWFCYLLFPLAALVLCRLGRRGTWLAIGLLYLVLCVSFLTVFSDTMNHSFGTLSLLRAAMEFLMGCLLRRVAGQSRGCMWTPIVICAAALWAASFLMKLPIGLAALPFFASLLLAASSNGSVVARILNASLLVGIGEASYALYMVQAPVQDGARVFQLYFAPDHSVRNAALVVAYLGTLALSTFLIHRFVENPSRRRLRSLIDALLPKGRRISAERRPAAYPPSAARA